MTVQSEAQKIARAKRNEELRRREVQRRFGPTMYKALLEIAALPPERIAESQLIAELVLSDVRNRLELDNQLDSFGQPVFKPLAYKGKGDPSG